MYPMHASDPAHSKFDAQASYAAMHGPAFAHSKHVKQSAGAAQSGAPVDDIEALAPLLVSAPVVPPVDDSLDVGEGSSPPLPQPSRTAQTKTSRRIVPRS
jgi:hypothetical protein